jgi:hypothetical protein
LRLIYRTLASDNTRVAVTLVDQNTTILTVVIDSTVIVEFAMSIEYTDSVVEGVRLLVPDNDLNVTVTPTVTIIL